MPLDFCKTMYHLSTDEITDIKADRAVLLDVRSDDEVADESCSYAKHWDVQSMMQGRMPNLEKEKPIFVYCRSGNRSALAQQLMLQAGFARVENIGGIRDVPQELCNDGA